ncbi:response regulator [Arenibaculum pallidiluteum]|uniref:response regulator n=1 Tax=Arenibaculum pallidiluteum TaxID=2812559 RepID=UPI001A96E723|nr:response regulator [Arenibaculum pallidiluteum]
MATKHVLIVDDDPAMRDMISNYLASHDFEVSTAADGSSMARIVARKPVDLIVLDLKLAHENGLDLMRELTGATDAPVIIVTGHRGEEADKVVGLELGADDYMTKPLGLRELVARIRAVLRRAERMQRVSRRAERHTYRFAGWQLETRMRRLISPTSEALRLTAGEFNLLMAFLRSPQQVLTREQLLAASRVHDEEVYDRSIDVLILRLRRKLEANPSDPTLIKTERGVGYVLAVPVEVL